MTWIEVHVSPDDWGGWTRVWRKAKDVSDGRWLYVDPRNGKFYVGFNPAIPANHIGAPAGPYNTYEEAIRAEHTITMVNGWETWPAGSINDYPPKEEK